MENSQPHALGLTDRRPAALGDFRVLPDDLICDILEYLPHRDVARLACVSSVMYILCNEEPLWMSLCLSKVNGPLQYKGSWKKTALDLEDVPYECDKAGRKPLYFDGFNSLFLYRRLYRCYTTLDGFAFDDGNVERKKDLTLEDFSRDYDGKKPVLLTGLADAWPARHTWTFDQLLQKYGDTAFKISRRSARKVSMKFKDYVSYLKIQHDEDPLYIFDHKFGEVAPALLKDYSVPCLFQEDFFDVLDGDKRPPFRWLIIGPQRSGASWHVDPALTSAWNTLLVGRKRWALYPPGRVPLGVTVHVNEEDGDVNIETPSSLQWWLDFYPLLADKDKPIECTQLPGETIFVPSGWWHCVLNLEPSIAVTQNFVNPKNFEFVCLDMAPGYHHKGVCRAGLLAHEEGNSDDATNNKDDSGISDPIRKVKRVRTLEPGEKKNTDVASNDHDLQQRSYQGFSYDIKFLAMYLDKERDHYNSPWSSGNCIGQREMREWLFKLWFAKAGMRDLIWNVLLLVNLFFMLSLLAFIPINEVVAGIIYLRVLEEDNKISKRDLIYKVGACLALNAGRWSECLSEICAFHNLPHPAEDEKLPVGTGSNPVYLFSDCVVKIFVEEGLERSLYGLGTELEFYNLLCKVNSPLKNHMPDVLESGIIYLENGIYRIIPWDAKTVPDVIARCNLIPEKLNADVCPFGVWSKKQFNYRKAGMPTNETIGSPECRRIWPYLITKRCKGKIYAELRDTISLEGALNLASFLGEQLRNLHLLPQPPLSISTFLDIEQEIDMPLTNGFMEAVQDKSEVPAEWNIFIGTLFRKKKDASSRLSKWGDPIPTTLIEKVDEYLPDDLAKFLHIFEDENGLNKVGKLCSWIHSDIMDDNIHMEPCGANSCLIENTKDNGLVTNGSVNGNGISAGTKSWRPSHILDFSDLSIGDPIYDIIPIYLDVFRGDTRLLKQLLESYKLPLVSAESQKKSVKGGDKFGQLSYHAMCYCILHDENVLGAIFSIWDELKTAKTWEEVEQVVWGELNNYKGFPLDPKI